jgi:phosphate uptake regulator
VQAVARGDVDAGERAVRDANAVAPMLDEVLQAVTRTPIGTHMRAWSAAAVLVARHVERVANNAAEIGARVRFLVTGDVGAPANGEAEGGSVSNA